MRPPHISAGLKPDILALWVNSLRGGGSERVMVTLANEFAQKGLDVHLLLGRAHGPYISDVSSSVKVVNFNTRSAIGGTVKLTRYISKVRPSALLSTNVMCNVSAVLAGKLARSRTRIVIREGSILSSSLESHRKHPQAVLRFAGRVAPFFYRRADAVIAVSRDAAKDMVERWGVAGEKTTAIYSPIITPDVIHQSHEEPEHAWFTDSIPILLSVGRLSPEKDHGTLFRAFAQVQEKTPCRLIVLGEGAERVPLEQLARNLGIARDVDMPGFVKNPFSYMRRASVYILSSLYEGLPGAMIQAMACNCPVVSTNCRSGPAEILDGGRYGHLVDVGSLEQMADAIREVLSGTGKKVDPEWLNQFKLESVLDQYLAVLGLRQITPISG